MRSNNRALLIVFVVLGVLALIKSMIGGTLFRPGGMREDTDRAPGWAVGLLAGFTGLSLLTTLATLIVGINLLIRWLGGGTSAGPSRGAQEENGSEQLGWISQEEFENMRKSSER